MRCSCCGQDRDDETVASLQCAPDVHVCRECIGSLRVRTGTVTSTPVLPVVDLAVTVPFYESIGFKVRAYDGGGYAFASLGGESVFDLGTEPNLDPAQNRSGCYLVVTSVDDWHARLAAAGCDVSAPNDEPYGMRELTLTDPDGNRLRFGQSIDCA